MIDWLLVLIIGGIIGLIAGAITSRNHPLGWGVTIITGLLGAMMGEAIFGNWGPLLEGVALIPTIVGAITLATIVALIFGTQNSNN